MRTLTAALALTLAAACSASETPAESLVASQQLSAPQADTKTLAVISYASWCGSCKILDPKVVEVAGTNPPTGVEFFALDYTDRDADAFFAQAAQLGIEETVRTRFADKIKTGFMLVIDVETGAIITEVTKDSSPGEIRSILEDATDA